MQLPAQSPKTPREVDEGLKGVVRKTVGDNISVVHISTADEGKGDHTPTGKDNKEKKDAGKDNGTVLRINIAIIYPKLYCTPSFFFQYMAKTLSLTYIYHLIYIYNLIYKMLKYKRVTFTFKAIRRYFLSKTR